MEEQVKMSENNFIKEKTRQKINALLNILTLEVEEELKESICNLIWFVQHELGERNYNFLYNPRVVPNDYKNVLEKNCISQNSQ